VAALKYLDHLFWGIIGGRNESGYLKARQTGG